MTVIIPLGPATVDFTGVRAGDRNLVNIKISSNGVPTDLTDAVVTAQARRRATDIDPTLTAIITVIDALNGELSLLWDGAEVTEVLAGSDSWSGVWDLQIANSDGGNAITVAAGKLMLVMDVTR